MSANEQQLLLLPVKEDVTADADPHDWLLRLSPLLQTLDLEEEREAAVAEGRACMTLAQLAARDYRDFIALPSEEQCRTDWDVATTTFTHWIVSPLPDWYWKLLVTLHIRDPVEAGRMRSALAARLMAAERDETSARFQLRRLNAMAQCRDRFASRISRHVSLDVQRAAETFICIAAATSPIDADNAELLDFYRAAFPQPQTVVPKDGRPKWSLYAAILEQMEETQSLWIVPAFVELWGVDTRKLHDFGNRTEWTEGWKTLETAVAASSSTKPEAVIWRLMTGLVPKHLPLLAHVICWKVDNAGRANWPQEYYHSDDDEEEAPEEGSYEHRRNQFLQCNNGVARQLGEIDLVLLVHEFHRLGRASVAIDLMLWYFESAPVRKNRWVLPDAQTSTECVRAATALNCVLDFDRANDAKNGLLLQRFVWDTYAHGARACAAYRWRNDRGAIDLFCKTVRMAQWPVPGSPLAHKLFRDTWVNLWMEDPDMPPALVPPAPQVAGCMGELEDDPDYEDDFAIDIASCIDNMRKYGWRDDLDALVRGLFADGAVDAAAVFATMPDGQPATYEQLMDAIRVRLTE